MLIVGNGPSTKELGEYGFQNIPLNVDTFGMGLAFKHFEKVGWWPTYYICADKKVVQHCRESLAEVVMDPKVRVKRFFFPIQLCESDRLEVIPHNSTGDFAFRKAVEFGYRQIFLIGIDLDYKPLKEATRISRSEFDELGLDIDYYTNIIYKIRRPVADHPNYFFPDYQEVGDIYSEPRGQSWHMLTWQRARELAERKKITVRNLGKQSKLKAFEMGDLRQALSSDAILEARFPKQSPAAVASEIFQAEKLLADKCLRELGEARELLDRQSGAAAATTAEFTRSFEALSKEIAGAVERQDNGIMVSVIIPAYNAAEFIAICLESLARQTLPQENFEVICIDDASTDNTVEVIESYRGIIANLKLVRQAANRKQGAARNAGIDAAAGRLVTFLDSDDFLRFDMLEIMLSLGRSADLTVCQHVKTRFDKPIKTSTSNRRVESRLSVAAFENTIGWWPFGMFISRHLLNRQGIRFREGVFFEDIDFNIRVYMAAKNHVVTKEPLYYYIERDASTVNLVDEKKLIDAASAMVEAWRIASGSPDEADREAFQRRAPRWLLQQARRLQDRDLPVEELSRLAALLLDQLTKAGLMKHLDPKLGPIILESATALPDSGANAPQQAPQGNQGYRPWKQDYRDEFAGKVIFYCEVDYHIRSAAPVVRKLRQFGVESIVVDASRSTSFTSNRPLPDEELPFYADINLRQFNVARNPPFTTEAAAFVFMNDLTYTRKLIFENYGFDVPTFGFYEGINDDWNLDRKAPRKPYRSVDYLLLPGLYQQGFYQDRQCRIVGLPNVRARLERPVLPRRLRRAIINVNFTYGVLEDKRGDYVESAVQACNELGLDYVISQHPADKADLSRFKVSRNSVYDLLEEGSILISRFSTTILEALAMGRPVVYHNPIGERVPKFHNPMGAYRKTRSVSELKTALEAELAFVDAGGAVRERAALFLHFHCNTGSPQEPDELAACAIAEVLAVPQIRFAFKTGTIARRTVPPVARLAPPQREAGTQTGAVSRPEDADGKGFPATGKRRLLIIGNGPSTRLLARAGFDKIPADMETWGTTVAYRYFESKGWWPTYYALADSKVVFHHRANFKRLIEDSKVTTSKFYLSWKVSDSPKMELIPHSSTGSFSLKKAVELGYDEIYLIGMEGAYVEEILESRALSDKEVADRGFGVLKLKPGQKKLRIIERTPTFNPNYFFADYQQAGDVYSQPQAHTHQRQWDELKDVVQAAGARVLNLSPISRIDAFERCDIREVFPFLRSDCWDDLRDPFSENAQHAKSVHAVTVRGGLAQRSDTVWSCPAGKQGQAVWRAIFSHVGVTAGRTLVAGIRLTSNRDLRLNITFGREGRTDFEGTGRFFTLNAGKPETVHLATDFSKRHGKLKLQVSKINCAADQDIDLTIEHVWLTEAVESVVARHEAEELTARQAGYAFDEGNDSFALAIWLWLARKGKATAHAENIAAAARRIGMSADLTDVQRLLGVLGVAPATAQVPGPRATAAARASVAPAKATGTQATTSEASQPDTAAAVDGPQAPAYEHTNQLAKHGQDEWLLNYDPQAKQQLLLANFDVGETRNRTYLGIVSVESDQTLSANISLGRTGTTPYEGSTTSLELAPGRCQWLALKHTFKSEHQGVKIQMDVKSCAGPHARISIKQCLLLPSAKDSMHSAPNDSTLAHEAHRLFRAKNYAESASLYAAVARTLGLKTFEFNARLSLRRLGISDEAQMDDLLARLG